MESENTKKIKRSREFPAELGIYSGEQVRELFGISARTLTRLGNRGIVQPRRKKRKGSNRNRNYYTGKDVEAILNWYFPLKRKWEKDTLPWPRGRHPDGRPMRKGDDAGGQLEDKMG